MTDEELDLMDRLWRAGMPSKQIARHLLQQETGSNAKEETHGHTEQVPHRR